MALRGGKGAENETATAVRATISFPPDIYEALEVIAKEKKVSLAWVVRDAAERYLADKWPLFRGQGRPQT
jgi:Ribbon-helix-helix protein, copG family